MIFFLVNFGPVPDGPTDGQKATPKSPPCISTGGLKNGWAWLQNVCAAMLEVPHLVPQCANYPGCPI